MTHPNLILNSMKFPTIHLHTPSSNNTLTRSYEFWHYRSFWKVNKNTFFVKASNLSMEYQIEMRPKGLIRGHLKLSIKSKNISKSSKLKKLYIVEVGLFAKLPKVNYPQNFKFCQMGPLFFTWFEFALFHTCPRFIHVPISHFYYLNWFLFEFIHFKSNKII